VHTSANHKDMRLQHHLLDGASLLHMDHDVIFSENICLEIFILKIPSIRIIL